MANKNQQGFFSPLNSSINQYGVTIVDRIECDPAKPRTYC